MTTTGITIPQTNSFLLKIRTSGNSVGVKSFTRVMIAPNSSPLLEYDKYDLRFLLKINNIEQQSDNFDRYFLYETFNSVKDPEKDLIFIEPFGLDQFQCDCVKLYLTDKDNKIGL